MIRSNTNSSPPNVTFFYFQVEFSKLSDISAMLTLTESNKSGNMKEICFSLVSCKQGLWQKIRREWKRRQISRKNILYYCLLLSQCEREGV